VAASASAWNSATLTWTAATDNMAVTSTRSCGNARSGR
jgi:hypothetical protein